jgi:hypothetical protein
MACNGIVGVDLGRRKYVVINYNCVIGLVLNTLQGSAFMMSAPLTFKPLEVYRPFVLPSQATAPLPPPRWCPQTPGASESPTAA